MFIGKRCTPLLVQYPPFEKEEQEDVKQIYIRKQKVFAVSKDNCGQINACVVTEDGNNILSLERH